MSETTPPAPITPAPAEPTPWTASLNDETKGWIENKGFKDPASMIDSYRNFEKLMGVPKERLLKLPEKEDDPAWADIHSRLGKPKDAKEYDLKDVKDEKFAEFSKNAFHKLGLTKKQGEALAAEWKNYHDLAQKAADESFEAKATEEENALKKEWGPAYDQNLNIAARAATAFGLDEATIDGIEKSLGYQKTMALFQKIGSKLGEGSFISGSNPGNGALTPAAALSQIQELMRDSAFSAKYAQGDSEAKAKMEALHKYAFPNPT